MADPQETYDFIVVGAGPAGASLARRLADTNKKPSVLLIEAGGKNDDPKYRLHADRYLVWLEGALNFFYKTQPQHHLANRVIDYSRGKGLGGSSAINFAAWTIGPRDDYDEWARIVEDDAFSWTNAQQVHISMQSSASAVRDRTWLVWDLRRYKSIESYDVPASSKYQKWCQPDPTNHGHRGPIRVSTAQEWENVAVRMFEAVEASEVPINLDLNSGDVHGIGAFVNTAMGSQRSTSAAYLEAAPSNLTVMTDSPIASLIMQGKTAVGVKTKAGSTYHASKDVVLSAGALDSIKILLLSGIGPKADLDSHGIPCQHDMPYLGKTLQDHLFTGINIQLQPGVSARDEFFGDPTAMEVARKEYVAHGTGPLSTFFSTICGGWLTLDAVKSSEEFKALPQNIQDRLNLPTNPTVEIILGGPSDLATDTSGTKYSEPLASMQAFLMNPQSQGTVTLASANPDDALVIQPNFFTHPYDRRVLIEAIRFQMKLVESAAFAKSCVKVGGSGPKDDSDAEIVKHIERKAGSSWHMSCTAKMGKDGDDTACVASNFKVKGLQGLRIADMSVTPFVPNCHVQTVAYLIGVTAAEKMIADYGLDSS